MPANIGMFTCSNGCGVSVSTLCVASGKASAIVAVSSTEPTGLYLLSTGGILVY